MTKRITSFIMCLVVVFMMVISAPVQQPQAALPVVLVPALVAVVSLAAAVGINFAVNAIAGETPTAQNNIAIAIKDALTFNDRFPLVNPLLSQLMNKDPVRVTAPDPTTGKSTYKMSLDEWTQARSAWYEYINDPFTNGTLKIETEEGLQYIPYSLSANGYVKTGSSMSNTQVLDMYNQGKGIPLELGEKYTWYGMYIMGDGGKRFGYMTHILQTVYTGTNQYTISDTWTLYNTDGSYDSEGTTTKVQHSESPITDYRFITTTTVPEGCILIYKALSTIAWDHYTAKWWNLPKNGEIYGTPFPASNASEKLYKGDFTYEGSLEEPTKNTNSIPYKVAPEITGSPAIANNWGDAIASDPLAVDQPFTIDFEKPDAITPATTIPGTLTDGVSPAVLDVAEYDIPNMERPTIKRLFLTKFPFCLPWDLAALFQTLSATPEAPRYEIDVFAPIKEDYGIEGNTKFVLDLAEFEMIGQFSRWATLLTFCYGLILMTRSLIRS